MKTVSIALTCAALALILPAIARTPAQPPSSAAHGRSLSEPPLEELPGVILTLADDSGRLIGGIAFNAVAGYGAGSRIIGRHAQAVMNLCVEGYTLRFELIRPGDGLKGAGPPA
jgi:hypothetical protein